jgi:integrase
MQRRTLSDKAIAALKPAAKSYTVADPALGGLYVRVQPGGSKSFVAVARAPSGKQVWVTIAPTAMLTIEQARDKAREAIKAIKAGEDRSGPQSCATVAEQWFKRHVEAKALRSAGEIRRYLDNHILPAWDGRDFTSIRRGDVAHLLDQIEDKAGPVAADKVLAHLSNLFGWYAARHDDYASPIVKGMRRSKPSERARDRILSDDELRAVWEAANGGSFGAFVKLLLLTGQRREKVAAMRWQDIAIDGTWTIPAEAREKGNARELQLPAMAVDIIRELPRFESNPYVFAGRGGSYSTGYSKGKKSLDARVKTAEPWTLHDIRRTARSLMSRAGIRPDIAERVLGHAIKGVEGIYDRHTYREEKAHALQALAGLVETILRGPVDNVVTLAHGSVASTGKYG